MNKLLICALGIIFLLPTLALASDPVFAQQPIYTRDPITGQIYRHEPVYPSGQDALIRELSRGFRFPDYNLADEERKVLENQKARQDIERKDLEIQILRKQLEQMEKGR